MIPMGHAKTQGVIMFLCHLNFLQIVDENGVDVTPQSLLIQEPSTRYDGDMCMYMYVWVGFVKVSSRSLMVGCGTTCNSPVVGKGRTVYLQSLPW